MTLKLFWEDSYMKEFSAKVLEIKGNEVVMDKTCFYPTSGGQICDVGWINSQKVVEVYYAEDFETIIHKLENEPSFAVGDEVKGKIDWERRYRIMKLHTATHLISAALLKNFGDVRFTGGQIYPEKARMDFILKIQSFPSG